MKSDLRIMTKTKPYTCEYCDNAMLDDCKIPNCGVLKCMAKVPAWVQLNRKPYDNYVSFYDGRECPFWVQLLEDK